MKEVYFHGLSNLDQTAVSIQAAKALGDVHFVSYIQKSL
jgi:hypothetical protein